MTDIREDDFNYDRFAQWAHRMLLNGTCAKVECPDHRHYEGPTAGNNNCRQCFKDRQGFTQP